MPKKYYAILSKNRGVVTFSLLKYVEILVTSFTTFFLAKKIGPEEMGFAIPVFLYITYANYLSLGVNQVVTKNLSRFKNKSKIISFLRINFQFLICVSFINMLLAFVLLDNKYAFLVGIISIFTIFKGFYMSYFRAVYKIFILNKNNLIFSILLFFSVFLFVNTLWDYLLTWAISLSFSLVLYFLDDLDLFKKIMKKLHKFPSRLDLIYNLKEGIKLAVAGLFTTILLTSDRFLINQLDVPVKLKGSYQLADYVGTAFYMIITTFSFYYQPKLIEKIRTDKLKFRKTYVNYIKKSFILVPFFLLLIHYSSKLVSFYIFPEYENLEVYVTLSVYVKLSVVYLSLMSLYHIGLDKETHYIKSLKFLVVTLVLALLLIYYLKVSFFWVPIAIGSTVFIESFRKLIHLK